MKYLLFTIAMIIGTVSAADLYVDAYRFDGVNHTGGLGIEGDKLHAEYYATSNKIAFGLKNHLTFTNIEIGVNSSITNNVMPNAKDFRVIDIEGGWYYIAKPYVKVGDKLFFTLMIDESNKGLIRVGFEIW